MVVYYNGYIINDSKKFFGKIRPDKKTQNIFFSVFLFLINDGSMSNVKVKIYNELNKNIVKVFKC